MPLQCHETVYSGFSAPAWLGAVPLDDCRGGRSDICMVCWAYMYIKTADLAQRQQLNVLSFIIYSSRYFLNYNGVQILPHILCCCFSQLLKVLSCYTIY